ncbi:MAG: HAD family hydrolase [Sphingobacteriaceae bacterium]|nr:HAD family hydrolase [Sphingobacteriaceae bacterium]
MKPALFLDRDGVINHDPGDYTCSPADFEFNPGIFDFLRKALQQNYLLIVVTNQGGIAKGLYTLETFYAINQKMLIGFAAEGIDIAEVYFCRHHPDYGQCLCRKPGSLFFEKAVARFDIDTTASLMIGDRDRDLEAAAAVGIPGILVPRNCNLNEQNIL